MSASGILYGLSSSDPGVVYTLNVSTGQATQLVTVDRPGSLVGLEYLNGSLWATDIGTNSGFAFGRIDLTTGVFTGVNTQAGSANWHGLAVDPATETFYSVDIDDAGFNLVSVTTTGVVTSVGPTNQNIRGLAWDPVHARLYGVDGQSFFTIDPGTGAATLVGRLGLDNGRPGLAFDALAGILYMNLGDTDNSLFTVNTTTGLATLIGPNGTVAGFGIDGLAFQPSTAVPEPATLLLLATGLGIAARRRTHRK